MDRLTRHFLFSLLLLTASQTAVAASFMVSNSAGLASISNIDGYDRAAYLRLDGSFFLVPQFGFNVFITDYEDFEMNNPNSFYVTPPAAYGVSLKLKGRGVGVTGRWPLYSHFQPFVRVEYFDWELEARALDRTIGKDSGGSTGFVVGAQFPIKKFFGIKAEALRYEDVSGADIEQLALGLTFEF